MQDREGKLNQTPQERYLAVVAKYAERKTKAEASGIIQKLETTALQEDEETELLKQIFEAEKMRQGINPN